MGAHLINGTFQSDKYPTCPAGKVPLSVKDPMSQDLLWQYAQRRREVDAEFSDDLEQALINAGYVTHRELPAIRHVRDAINEMLTSGVVCSFTSTRDVRGRWNASVTALIERPGFSPKRVDCSVYSCCGFDGSTRFRVGPILSPFEHVKYGRQLTAEQTVDEITRYINGGAEVTT